jgi:uncharacterized NAD(P)/FAD-binding protein YdhS
VNRIAIVGGGFSGAVAAICAIERASPGTTICIYEPNAELGRGVAYATGPDHYLLNVVAHTLAIRPGLAGDFLAWALDTKPEATLYEELDGSYYFPRSWFGTYVGEKLRVAIAARSRDVQFVHRRAVVRELKPTKNGLVIVDHIDRQVFDTVVLALGSAPPRPLAINTSAQSRPQVVQSAWDIADHPIAPGARIVIVGTGLTMADVVAELDARGHVGTIACVSRHGRMPHVSGGYLRPFVPPQADPAMRASALLRRVRDWARQSNRDLGDWRPAIDHARRHTTELWRALPSAERERLYRHARPLWEVHRYQMPPAAHRRLLRLGQAERLRHVCAQAIGVVETGLLVRAAGQPTTLPADVVINATGFDASFGTALASLGPLLQITGLDLSHIQKFGLSIDDAGAVKGAVPPFAGRLFALGFLARAAHGDLANVQAIGETAEKLGVRLFARSPEIVS